MKMPSKVPKALAGSLAALVMLAAGVSIQNAEPTPEALRNEYIQAVAADTSTSMAVKIAMVMGSQYESSGKHIGKPYVDKLGRGKPLTVCNGVTGPEVVARRYYTPADCFRIEKRRYLLAEAAAMSSEAPRGVATAAAGGGRASRVFMTLRKAVAKVRRSATAGSPWANSFSRAWA